MAIKSGFFNSFNHDRRYNADDFGRIFDGLIRDGIYMGFGDAFRVSPFDSESMKINVGTGRAWFNHTWMVNESPIILDIDQSEIAMKRIDSVVIEINKTTEIRANRILIIKGAPSVNPTPPVIEQTSNIKRYVLANIKLNENVTKITTSDIENMIGKDNTPYVTGIIQTINIDRLIDQWQSQWSDFKKKEEKETDEWQNAEREEVNNWEDQLNQYTTNKQNEVNTWHDNNVKEISDYMRDKKAELDTWVNGIKNILNEEAIVKLTAMYNEINEKVKQFEQKLDNKLSDINRSFDLKLSDLSAEILSYIIGTNIQISDVVFNDDGSIDETGNIFDKNTVFNDDGSILQTYKFKIKGNEVIKIKITFTDTGVQKRRVN